MEISQVLDCNRASFGEAEVLALVLIRDALVLADSDVAEVSLGNRDGSEILVRILLVGRLIAVPVSRLGAVSVKVCDKAELGIGGKSQ